MKRRKAAEAADKQGVAFAEGGKGTEYIPNCHGCGNKCKDGWRECKNITEEHRAKVAALKTQRNASAAATETTTTTTRAPSTSRRTQEMRTTTATAAMMQYQKYDYR